MRIRGSSRAALVLLVMMAALLAIGPAQAAGGGGGPGGVQVPDTEASPDPDGPLTQADRDFLAELRLAGLWQGPAAEMAASKGVSPRVRQIGTMIAQQHGSLDALEVRAAAALKVRLPDKPTVDQQGWLTEMREADGPVFDQVFVDRLRAADGKVFADIAEIRSGTRNEVIRRLAQQANQFFITRLTLLESTGLVNYRELPPPSDPGAVPVQLAAVQSRARPGGVPSALLWSLLIVGLLTGAAGLARMVRIPIPS